MDNTRPSKINDITLKSFGIGVLALASLMVPAQQARGQEMQQRLAEIKQSLAFNKQVLAQYTWMDQQIISIKGEQKKEELYNVQMGPDGKPQKTPVDPSDAVNVNLQFARLPNGGPFHVATESINRVSKQPTIEIINTNYQHM